MIIMRSLTKTLVEKVISFIDNQTLSLRVIADLPTSVCDLVEDRLVYYDHSQWQIKMYYCQAELQTKAVYNHWSSWIVYSNIMGEREYFDEITIQVEPDSNVIYITPHENYNKWKAYQYFTDINSDLSEHEVEEFIDDYDY